MIPDIAPFNNYSGNNSATKFDYDPMIENENQLIVMHTDKNGRQTELKLNVDYTIHGVGNENGGYILFPIVGSSYDVLSDDEVISLYLNLPIEQQTPFGTSDRLDMNILEKTFDYIVRVLQILNRSVERSVKIQEGSKISPDELVSSLQESEVNAQNCAQRAESAANNADIKAGIATNKADIATQKVVQIEKLSTETIFGISDKQYQAEHAIETALAGAQAQIETNKTNAISSIDAQLESSINSAKEDITTSKNDAQSQINQKFNSVISDIETKKTKALDELQFLKTDTVFQIGSTKDSAINEINTKVTSAKADVQTSVDNISAIETNIVNISTRAQEYALRAQEYAQNDYNVPVEADAYSAKHWAQVAHDTAQAVGDPLNRSLSNINDEGRAFLKELSGGNEAGAGYFGLPVFCVNMGTPEGIFYNYGFRVSEENPVVVTFSNGYTKTFKEFLKIPDAPDIGDTVVADETTKYYYAIDFDGNILDFTTQTKSKTEPTNIRADMYPYLWIDTSDKIPVAKVKTRGVTGWEIKNLVPFAEYKFLNDVTTITNYPYNTNGFDDYLSRSIVSNSQAPNNTFDSANLLEINLSHKFYDFGTMDYGKYCILKKDVNFPSEGMGIFYLSVYVNTTLKVEIADTNYKKVKFAGGEMGTQGKGRYLATLFYNFSNDDTFMKVDYFPEIPEEGPGEVDPPVDPFDPFA